MYLLVYFCFCKCNVAKNVDGFQLRSELWCSLQILNDEEVDITVKIEQAEEEDITVKKEQGVDEQLEVACINAECEVGNIAYVFLWDPRSI